MSKRSSEIYISLITSDSHDERINLNNLSKPEREEQ